MEQQGIQGFDVGIAQRFTAAKLLLGTSTGNGAVIVTLIIAAAPYVARRNPPSPPFRKPCVPTC